MPDIDNQSLSSRLLHCSNLPSPPGIAIRIIELCQHAETTIADVAKIVGHDPAIATKVLRVANSPMYARQRKIENLRQAIALLGLNGTLTLALGFSLVKTTKTFESSCFDYDHYWRRCLATAICCQLLGKLTGLPDKEKLFLVGLVQDIGVLALDKIEPKLYQQLNGQYPSHAQILQLEKSSLGVEHAAIGAWLLTSWNFPEDITAITYASHDTVKTRSDTELERSITVCQIANSFADIWWQDNANEALDQARQQAKDFLGLSDVIITTMLHEAGQLIQDTIELFEIDPAIRHQPELIMEQAKEVLAMRHLSILQQSADLKQNAESLIERTRVLEEENRRDNLTGLYNRHYLENALEGEYATAIENNFPLTVIFIDLDHFKTINDNHGHQIGDEVLIHCAKLLTNHTRGSDIVARYGGEEFIALLPGTDQQGAEIVCKRMLKSLRDRAYQISDKTEIHVTASIGIASLDENSNIENPNALIRSADRALYLAKTNGRDQVAIYR